MMNQPVIIWDWNGTLLNDLSVSIASINEVLQKRMLPRLTPKTYRDIFTFPVRDYYEAAGFDFSNEDFEIPAMEFINSYKSKVKECTLHKGSVEVLSLYKKINAKQYVLSAMEQEMLEKTLRHNRIFHFFEGVAGLDDHYAVSKAERGEQLISQFGIRRKGALLIGDTIHDFEVAQKLGINCFLIANGHQSKKRLKKTGVPVFENLQELILPLSILLNKSVLKDW